MLSRVVLRASVKGFESQGSRKYTHHASHESILLERDMHDGVDTGVRIVKLNNPSKLNALTEASGNRFKAIMSEIAVDEAARAVVLTGAGKAFSAGGDLDFLDARTKDTPNNNTYIMREFYGKFLSFRSALRIPVISAINGAAVGAGLCLATATDIRIAYKDATMGFNFVQLGLHPGMGATFYLPRVVPAQVAHRLLLTGELIKGEEAQKLGLVLSVHESPEETVSEALKMARKIAQASPEAVQATLHTLRQQTDQNVVCALQREADAQAHSYTSAQLKEGLDAVKNKRKPKF